MSTLIARIALKTAGDKSMRNRSMAALTAMLVSVGLCSGAANATMVGAPAKIVVRKSPIV
jgi:hypothetical protein